MNTKRSDSTLDEKIVAAGNFLLASLLEKVRLQKYAEQHTCEIDDINIDLLVAVEKRLRALLASEESDWTLTNVTHTKSKSSLRFEKIARI